MIETCPILSSTDRQTHTRGGGDRERDGERGEEIICQGSLPTPRWTPVRVLPGLPAGSEEGLLLLSVCAQVPLRSLYSVCMFTLQPTACTSECPEPRA